MDRQKIASLIAAVFLLLFGRALPPAEAAPLKVAFSAFTSTYLPLWVAEEKGFFKSQGLELEIMYGRGGSSTTQALLAGSYDVALGGGGPIEANLAGADAIYMAVHVPTLVLSLFSKPEIGKIEELKGKKIGTTAAASTTDYGVRLTLKRYGLSPSDVNIIYTGGMDNTFASLSKGLIDAGIFSGPIILSARKSGFRELLDIASLRIPFIHEAVAVRRSYVKESRDTLKRFLKGFVLGIRLTKSDRVLSHKMIEKYLKLKDREVIEASYDEIVGYFASEPFVPKAATQNVLSLLADRVPAAKTAPPDRFYDNSLLDDLKNEGFFK